MLYDGRVDELNESIAETETRTVQSVLRGDLPDATSQLLLAKSSVSPSKRFVKPVVRSMDRKSRDLTKN